MFGTIILFIILLSLLVFVHEFGHFIVARKTGMKVEEFGFGFPPRLFGIKKGDTLYSINWIPLGGFVRVKGEAGDKKDESDSFSSKSAWKRFLVLIAGVAMNMILAAVLLMVGFGMGIPSVVDEHVPAYVTVKDQAVRIVSVLPGSPASAADIQMGDTLISIDEQTFLSASAAREYIAQKNGDPVSLTLKRADELLVKTVESAYLEEAQQEGIGVGLVETALISYPWYRAIGQGIMATGALTWEILSAFGQILKNLVLTQEAGMELSGPVGIAVMTGQVAALGISYLLQFAAILSINLAIINILPFPALDGGRILFVIIEKLRRGKPVNQKIETIVHNLGFIFLMSLVVLVTYQDIVKFFVK